MQSPEKDSDRKVFEKFRFHRQAVQFRLDWTDSVM